MTCIFCSIIAGHAPGHVLFRSDRVVAFLSLEGHPLIAPLRHFAGIEELDDETGAEIFQSAKKISIAVRSATGCEGINLVLSDGRAAGQDVFHLHMHVKPRWSGDDVNLTWTTKAVHETERASIADDIRRCLPKAPV